MLVLGAKKPEQDEHASGLERMDSQSHSCTEAAATCGTPSGRNIRCVLGQ